METRPKQARPGAALAKNAMAQLFQALPNAAALIDPDGRTLAVNSAFQSVFGFSATELASRSLCEALGREEGHARSAEFQQLCRGEQKTLEACLFSKSGSALEVSISALPVLERRRQVGAFVVFTDVGERRRLEDLRAGFIADTLRAQENERTRIARELHDGAGQHLTALMAGLLSLVEAIPEGSGRKEVMHLLLMNVDAIEEVRRVARGLRPSTLEDVGFSLAVEGFVADLGWSHRLQTDVYLSGFEDRKVPPEVELALYRIVQEALTNVVRHAQATKASVVLTLEKNRARLIVEDDGRGFDAAALPRGGLGLQGIRERAALLAGSVVFESRPGRGTAVYVEIPLATAVPA